MPRLEELSNYKSGGEYRVKRYVDVEVYSKLLDRKKALEQCEYLISQIKDIVQDNIDWSDNAIDTLMPSEVYEPIDEYQSGTISLIVRSVEDIYDTINDNTIIEVNSNDLIQVVFNTINAYRTSGSPSLGEVKTFYRGYQVPTTGLPAVVVFEDELERDRRWAGADNPNRKFKVTIFTPLKEKETNLQFNIEIMEKIKDIIQANYKWGGYAWDTKIERVTYDTIREIDYPLYATTVHFTIKCIELL